jgi:Domain of unknown function (DUF4304)
MDRGRRRHRLQAAHAPRWRHRFVRLEAARSRPRGKPFNTMTIAAARKQALLSSMWHLLKLRGFKNRGAIFHKPIGDVVHLISLQSSQSSTHDCARVTVNLAVRCIILDDAGIAPSVWNAHWRERLGHEMPAKADVWWTISSDEGLASATSEIMIATEAYGLPALDNLQSSASLLALWDSGVSPGLTRRQATECAERLPASAIEHSSRGSRV